MTDSQKTWSVTELNSIVRGLLETRIGQVRVQGEISNFTQPRSGHMYFTLKDDSAQIRCAMFRNRNMRLRFTPENGGEVIASGNVSLYEPRGDYQFIIETLEPAGSGALAQEFERLKQKLLAEGLFDHNKKQSIPRFPKTIAVVTSGTGAALQDILNVIRRRYPIVNVNVYPVPVQGDKAAGEIIEALNTAQHFGADVVVIARGGGSIEDLWAFNNEGLARAIAACTIPVVSGVGHEIDFTITDFVADHRAPTPSAAAEMVTPDGAKLEAMFDAFQPLLTRTFERKRQQYAQKLDWLEQRLQRQHPARRIGEMQQKIGSISLRLSDTLLREIQDEKQKLLHLAHRLNLISPLARYEQRQQSLRAIEGRLMNTMAKHLDSYASSVTQLQRLLSTLGPDQTLQRGYAIARHTESGRILHDAGSVEEGDCVDIVLGHGGLRTEVKRRL